MRIYDNINGQKAKNPPDEGSIDSGEGYYWMNYACLKELSDKWTIADYYSIPSSTTLNDNFSVTVYQNGNNIVKNYLFAGYVVQSDSIYNESIVYYHNSPGGGSGKTLTYLLSSNYSTISNTIRVTIINPF